MATTQVSALTPGAAANPIEVRVIRKWFPFMRKNELCYLFLDKNGDAIEAIANSRDEAHFEAKITLSYCYRITNYICDKARHMYKVVPHPATLRIGKNATFVQVPDMDFPSYYFNFVEYERLHTRLNNNELLTDYIGNVSNVSDILPQKKTNLLRIQFQDPSGPFIEATLWEEIATSFDITTVRQSPSPFFLALTSLKVTEYLGSLQLSATAATHIYFNPDIELTKSLTARFHESTSNTVATDIMLYKGDKTGLTFADLLDKKADVHIGTRFTCTASIKDIDQRRGWYYKGCTECQKKLQPRDDTLACPDHGEILQPKPLFCITATIDDGHTSIGATFFNKAVTSILEKDCTDLVVKEGYTDPLIIPQSIHSIRGKTYGLHLQVTKRSHQNSNPVIVTQAFTVDPSTPITPVLAETHPPNTPTSSPTPSTPAQKRISHPTDTTQERNKLTKA